MLDKRLSRGSIALAAFALLLAAAQSAPAQSRREPAAEFLRSNPQILGTFRPVVAQASQSTVRVLCDGQETALGVVVGADGWVLTKANDLKGKLSCKLKDGRQLDARLVGVHEAHDLAMLKIEATGLRPVEWTDSKAAAVGHWVACVGPGADPVGVGVVSVGTRDLPNRGKALISVPPSGAGYLGISLEPGDGGVRISQVMPNTAASKAGLKENDLITELAGKKVREPDQFLKAIQKFKSGETVTLKFWRDEAETELKVTLGKRPPNRGDIQNNMGSKLSSRITGYPTILQHDTVVQPNDCGGPIVDLDGKVIGLNICRAGRTESWAVPSEVILPVLADLKSGKLAPPAAKQDAPAPEPKATKKAEPQPKAGPKPKSEKPAADVPPTVAVDEVLHGIFDRLVLVHDVARWKWNAGKLAADPVREKALLDRVTEQAKARGLDPEFARGFFRRAG